MVYDFGIHLDNKDSTKYVADIGQDGLGMPDRDYYLKLDDAKLSDTRAKYLAHVEKMLSMAGEKNAVAYSKAIVDLETEIARVHWTRVELRDPVKTYNKVELAKLAETAPGWDWNTWLKDTGTHPCSPILGAAFSSDTHIRLPDRIRANTSLHQVIELIHAREAQRL